MEKTKKKPKAKVFRPDPIKSGLKLYTLASGVVIQYRKPKVMRLPYWLKPKSRTCRDTNAPFWMLLPVMLWPLKQRSGKRQGRDIVPE